MTARQHAQRLISSKTARTLAVVLPLFVFVHLFLLSGHGFGLLPVPVRYEAPQEVQIGELEVDELPPNVVDLGAAAQNAYHIPVGPSDHGTTSFFRTLESFVNVMPMDLREDMFKGIAAHRPPNHPELIPSVAATTDLSKYRLPMVHYRNIFQTDKKEPGELTADWASVNKADGWALDFFDDAKAEHWVESHFGNVQDGTRGVLWAWKYMKRGVLKSDLLRYLLPLLYGGVYSDTDTRCVRPIVDWGKTNVETLNISATDGPDWLEKQADEPQIIVALETDVHGMLDWGKYWPRPAGVCQWTLSGSAYHPVLLEVVRRVVNHTEVVERAAVEESIPQALQVVEWTGPGAFSDAVFGYLLARYNVTWHRFRGIKRPVRVGEVMVLPITAFSPGGHADFEAGPPDDPQCDVHHFFAGSWKGDGW